MTGRRVVGKNKNGEDVFGTTLILPVPNPQLKASWSSNIWNSLDAGETETYYELRKYVGKLFTRHVLYMPRSTGSSFIETSLAGQWPELNVGLYAGDQR